MRQPIDTPARFVTEDGAAAAGEGCRNPLVDSRDQIRLRLVRSGPVDSTLQGDYEAPEGRYGVRAGELLRVDCRTGQPVGIVEN